MDRDFSSEAAGELQPATRSGGESLTRLAVPLLPKPHDHLGEERASFEELVRLDRLLILPEFQPPGR
jgi:hypothetical protein